MQRRTKIVATIGPASAESTQLRRLLEAGVDVCRLNCSHSGPEGLRRSIARIRRVASELERPVGILLDLQGPKIRTGDVETPLELEDGGVLTLVMDADFVGAGARIGTTFPSLIDELSIGVKVLFADGTLSGEVSAIREDVVPGEVDITMHVGGALGSHKGINIPGIGLQTSSLTEKDRVDLEAGVAAGVDYVALSFVRSGDDIDELRTALKAFDGERIPVCAKIEKPQALENIEGILERVDAIMVARGDLGVEIPLEQVPIAQKQLIHAANRAGVLVITATQMLDSMERNPRPTRAETTDVANAILDGTDAIMLSGETAVGRYPIRAVEVMDTIARQAEASPFFVRPPLEDTPNFEGHGGALSRAASFLVRENAFPVVVFTWSGSSAIVISKSRPMGPVFALTPHSTVYDALSLVWGVTPIMVPTISTTDELVLTGERVLRDQGLVRTGEEIVVLAGQTSTRGVTNLLKVEVVQDR